jgi:hypothetical protein
MLSNADQRRALIAFVDAALGGADRTTEAGVIWLPLVAVDDPPLVFALTIDEGRPDGLHVGVGVRVRTVAPVPVSNTTLAIPLFRVKKEGGPAVTEPLLLGTNAGRIRLATQVTLDAAPAVPGQARLGGIGIEIDIPTGEGGSQPASLRARARRAAAARRVGAARPARGRRQRRPARRRGPRTRARPRQGTGRCRPARHRRSLPSAACSA